MSGLTVSAFDRTIEKTNIWLNDLMRELDWDDRERAYHALRAVLHAVREHLPVPEVADFGAQLPMLVRGCYYEGWSPGGTRPVERKKEQFLAHIAQDFRGDPRIDAEHVTRAVLKVISLHVTRGEVDDVKANMPAAIRDLWCI